MTPAQEKARSKDAESGTGVAENEADKVDILYTVDQRPPLPLLIILAFQQFLTMFGATFSYPILLAPFLCMSGDNVGISQLVSTVIFVAGVATIIQTTVGIRLPIIQSSSYAFVTPFIVLLTLPKWSCPGCQVLPEDGNLTVCGSDAHGDIWKSRLREVQEAVMVSSLPQILVGFLGLVQGAVMVSSLLQILVGFTGLVGVLLRFIGPLTITPTITMIGLSLFDAASGKAQGQWWIALMTLALIAIFSQYMRNISIPFCGYRSGRGCTKSSLRFFALFPVISSIAVSWLLCYIFTATDVFPSERDQWGYLARTDVQGDVLDRAPWFRIPYPGQWGMPTVSAEGVLGALAATIASIIESIGDYFACARLSGAPPPPSSAVNRGIGIEGITSLLAGAWGSGSGTTSYSENVGAIGITKVGSRSVVQMSGLLMVIMACVGKFSAIFVTIPEPIVGGLFLGMFGMVTAVGLSNLQFVDLNSTRNLFVLGLSIFLAFGLPRWLSANANAIDTGSAQVDNILSVLCSTSIFVAGAVAFFLDNTIPGTLKERGIQSWQPVKATTDEQSQRSKVYDLPFIQPWLNKFAVTKYLPFCPGFKGFTRKQPSSPTNGHSPLPPKQGATNAGFEEGNARRDPESGSYNTAL